MNEKWFYVVAAILIMAAMVGFYLFGQSQAVYKIQSRDAELAKSKATPPPVETDRFTISGMQTSPDKEKRFQIYVVRDLKTDREYLFGKFDTIFGAVEVNPTKVK